MPKTGMEPLRRAALVDAAIVEIGAARSLDVTVAQIARRAGMSSGLAHHYFGGKDQMLLAAMKQILSEFSQKMCAGLHQAKTPRERLEAVVRANFADHVFDRSKTSAWLSFYGLAQSNDQAAYLMRIYQRRLRSNLLFDLKTLTPRADEIAAALGALIDGVYLRAALTGTGPDPKASETVLMTLNALLGDTQ
ncbi:choline-binding transcriptional repressor BetI [Shimia thalassica]|uniref:choline-binding transcriptional repressor BetI n=1 Tax=Shimia thalassica TaxID=1715693 RepID=UPI0026E1D387|nr:transcriptional regulator BetI [Shimia thalassica]MDO6797370.1 transcriptional regulator BetI [Shimia thalassica]